MVLPPSSLPSFESVVPKEISCSTLPPALNLNEISLILLQPNPQLDGGVAFHMEDYRKIIKVQLLEAEKRQYALENEILFPQDNACMLPTPALDDEAKIVSLNLGHLPFCQEQ